MRQSIKSLSLVILLQLIAVSVYAQSPSNAPSISPVERVLAAKVMTNYPDGKFHPERLISRAELAAILVKTFELDKRLTQASFTQPQDVPQTHWAFDYIQTVLRNDIMRGYRGNQFFPNQKITRAEAFAIFAQAYGVFQFSDEAIASTLARYPDTKNLPDWARKPMATALSEGFVNIDNQNKINPLKPMTRGDMVYAISKYLQRQAADPTVPQPIPTPDPTPTPIPQPIPTPDPTPTPIPQPIPTPDPTPTPIPQPIPTPDPTPTPIPQPIPTPDPTPTPIPQPIPTPTPSQTPSFEREIEFNIQQ